jgi:hypothetical protein
MAPAAATITTEATTPVAASWTTSTTATTTAILTRPGFVNFQNTTTKLFTVELIDS